MITLEKLFLLKSVSLFKHMPDDLLLQLADTLAHEKTVAAGEVILEKGRVNNYIYIIATGQVRVHDEQGHSIKELSAREIFGELSALTGQAAVSYITAMTECLLLRISNDALYDLMSIEPELSKGIILALCERTQKMSFQIQELMNEAEMHKTA